MMIPPFAFMLLSPQFAAPTTPAKLTPTTPARLVAASLFKNGFAVTQRLIEVKKPGETLVLPIPQGAMGTVWFTPSVGMTLDSVAVENEGLTSGGKAPANNIGEILRLNVGRTVTLSLVEDGKTSRLVAKITAVAGEIVAISTPQGTTRILQKGAIVGVEGNGLKLDSPFSVPSSRRVMRVRTSGAAGKVGVVALERGLSWVPAYAVNLNADGKTLDLVAKATVVNDLEPLKSLDARFVTGFPNLPFANQLDPLVEWTMGGPGGFGGIGGGMGGGGFGGQFANQSRAPEAKRGANVGFQEGDALGDAGLNPDGIALGELFFYHRPGVTLDVNGRGAYTLFRVNTPYEAVYAWDIGDPAPGQPRFEARVPPPGTPSTEEVWQTLRFKNSGKVPFTTGPATTFSEGQILGQDTLRYVSVGQTAELRVTRSLDVSADATEEEKGRERGFVMGDNGNGAKYPVFDRVTTKGTLTVVNRKASEVKMRIRKSFTGEWISGDGNPEVRSTAPGLRQPNPTGVAEWLATVPPGGTLKLTYSTRLLVSS